MRFQIGNLPLLSLPGTHLSDIMRKIWGSCTPILRLLTGDISYPTTSAWSKEKLNVYILYKTEFSNSQNVKWQYSRRKSLALLRLTLGSQLLQFLVPITGWRRLCEWWSNSWGQSTRSCFRTSEWTQQCNKLELLINSPPLLSLDWWLWKRVKFT